MSITIQQLQKFNVESFLRNMDVKYPRIITDVLDVNNVILSFVGDVLLKPIKDSKKIKQDFIIAPFYGGQLSISHTRERYSSGEWFKVFGDDKKYPCTASELKDCMVQFQKDGNISVTQEWNKFCINNIDISMMSLDMVNEFSMFSWIKGFINFLVKYGKAHGGVITEDEIINYSVSWIKDYVDTVLNSFSITFTAGNVFKPDLLNVTFKLGKLNPNDYISTLEYLSILNVIVGSVFLTISKNDHNRQNFLKTNVIISSLLQSQAIAQKIIGYDLISELKNSQDKY